MARIERFTDQLQSRLVVERKFRDDNGVNLTNSELSALEAYDILIGMAFDLRSGDLKNLFKGGLRRNVDNRIDLILDSKAYGSVLEKERLVSMPFMSWRALMITFSSTLASVIPRRLRRRAKAPS